MTDNCNVCVHIVQFGSVNKKKNKKNPVCVKVRFYGTQVVNGLSTSRDQVNRRIGGGKRAVECDGLVSS